MHSALNPLMEHLDCEQCHEVLRDRIKDVVVQWASVGVSAFLSSSSSDVLFLSSILFVSPSFHLEWRDAFFLIEHGDLWKFGFVSLCCCLIVVDGSVVWNSGVVWGIGLVLCTLSSMDRIVRCRLFSLLSFL